MSDINSMISDVLGLGSLVFENQDYTNGKTTSELEATSMSHVSGIMFYYEDDKESAFLFKLPDTKEYLEIYFPKKPYALQENEEIDGTIEDRRLKLNPKISHGTFNGGGALTHGHGIDFTFETTLFPGKYNIREMTGMNSNIKLTRI